MAVAATNLLLYLPDDCWEHVFKFLTYDDDRDDYKHVMKSLSVVSKQFFSITNRLGYSITIRTDQYTYKTLPILFQRFSNLTSLKISFYRYYTCYPKFPGDLNYLLLQISQFPLKLTSLTFSTCCTIPINGLRAFSEKITTLTSLTFSNLKHINCNDIFFIGDSFPLLEELSLSYGGPCFNIPIIVEPLSSVLFKLRKVNLSNHYINDKLLFHLFKNCKLLEEANLSHCMKLTNSGIASALLESPTLKSLSFDTLEEWAMLSAFTQNCPSLSEITVQRCKLRNKNFNSLVVSPQLKSLSFVSDCWLTKEAIKVFALFPNLVRLDLKCCDGTKKVLFQLLSMSCKLRHLNLSHCSKVDDKTLHVISKSCRGLLQLILENCDNVTEKGVKHVVEKCTQLREINLRNCYKVDADVAALILLSRPSLIKIIAPPRKMSSNKRGNCSCPQCVNFEM